MRLTMLCAALLVTAPACTMSAATHHGAVVTTPAAAADELLAADRAFAAAGAGQPMIDGFAAMLADDAVMPSRKFGFSRGKDAIVAALRDDPANLTATAERAPVRVGISADGLHGFTYGFINVRRPGQPDERAKYLAYWVKGDAGWRVALFKRGRSAPGAVATELRAASVPDRLRPADPAAIPAHKASLVAAERAFSDRAQVIGVGKAFTEFGSPDAMNMGAGSDFTFGNAAIGAAVGDGDAADPRAPIHWGADEGALVASSGDLGVTWGWIRSHELKDGKPAQQFPFFTVWRRADPQSPWRYIAE